MLEYKDRFSRIIYNDPPRITTGKYGYDIIIGSDRRSECKLGKLIVSDRDDLSE